MMAVQVLCLDSDTDCIINMHQDQITVNAKTVTYLTIQKGECIKCMYKSLTMDLLRQTRQSSIHIKEAVKYIKLRQ